MNSVIKTPRTNTTQATVHATFLSFSSVGGGTRKHGPSIAASPPSLSLCEGAEPSPQEPKPEKACSFLLAVSLWACHYPYAEVEVLEYQDPTASRHMEMHELAMVGARVDAAGNNPF